MTPEQKAVYIYAKTVAAQAEILGMHSDNKQREIVGSSMAYDHQAFVDVIEAYGISHNQVLSFFNE